MLPAWAGFAPLFSRAILIQRGNLAGSAAIHGEQAGRLGVDLEQPARQHLSGRNARHLDLLPRPPTGVAPGTWKLIWLGRNVQQRRGCSAHRNLHVARDAAAIGTPVNDAV